MAISSPPIIERDSNGRPIRPGYIPVEEKIQKELKDLKSREVELKRIRKVRNQSHSESLDKKYDMLVYSNINTLFRYSDQQNI